VERTDELEIMGALGSIVKYFRMDGHILCDFMHFAPCIVI